MERILGTRIRFRAIDVSLYSHIRGTLQIITRWITIGGVTVPKVGGKHYTYDAKGRAEAKRAKAKLKKKSTKRRGR